MHRVGCQHPSMNCLSENSATEERARNAVGDYYPLGIEEEHKEKGHAEKKIS